MSAHTPGPWKVSRANPHTVIVADGRSVGLTVCRVKPFLTEYREQSLANARLIAAAPKLFETLNQLLSEAEDIFVCMADATGIDRHNMPKPLQLARAVISELEAAPPSSHQFL